MADCHYHCDQMPLLLPFYHCSMPLSFAFQCGFYSPFKQPFLHFETFNKGWWKICFSWRKSAGCNFSAVFDPFPPLQFTLLCCIIFVWKGLYQVVRLLRSKPQELVTNAHWQECKAALFQLYASKWYIALYELSTSYIP